MLNFISDIKRNVVSRMFWGRTPFYKNILHAIILVVTISFTLTGLFYRVSNVSANQDKLGGNLNSGTSDLLVQGGSISTVVATDLTRGGLIQNAKYQVREGDSLQTIADSYGVTIDTIRWSNPNLISPFTNDIQVGWDLLIPNINGVLYTVRQGQTLNDIIAITSVNNSESNRFNIIELNQLREPDNLKVGTSLFIPDGNLINQDINVTGIPRGVFSNPLDGCEGYIWQRGFSYYHDGVDLSKWDGCLVKTIATGTVYYAKWETLSGLTVKVDHGGGIHSYYYHLRDIYVQEGERVQQGQNVGYMGSTGNSTGTHLHFTLKKDYIAVDSQEFVPY